MSGQQVFGRHHPNDGIDITQLDDALNDTYDVTLGYDAANRVNSATTTEAGVQQTWG